jgi:hypothetical protein
MVCTDCKGIYVSFAGDRASRDPTSFRRLLIFYAVWSLIALLAWLWLG